VVFTEENKTLLEILRRKQIATGNGDKKSVNEEASTSFDPLGNTATYAHSTNGTGNIHALISISTTRPP
jgi:AAA15 family ATPase/GTPase